MNHPSLTALACFISETCLEVSYAKAATVVTYNGAMNASLHSTKDLYDPHDLYGYIRQNDEE